MVSLLLVLVLSAELRFSDDEAGVVGDESVLVDNDEVLVLVDKHPDDRPANPLGPNLMLTEALVAHGEVEDDWRDSREKEL